MGVTPHFSDLAEALLLLAAIAAATLLISLIGEVNLCSLLE